MIKTVRMLLKIIEEQSEQIEELKSILKKEVDQ